MSRADDAAPPPGFRPLPPIREGDFNDLCGPWFAKDEDGRLVGGFRVLEHHLNPNRTCHGGMLATFLDVHLALAGAYQGDAKALILPTISLSLAYLERVEPGAWVEARADLLRQGRRMVFMQGLATVEGRAKVRADGVFSIPSEPAADGGTGARMRAWLRDGETAPA